MKTMNIRKLLVPIDFSNSSINALYVATAIAKRHQAEIHLLYVDDCDFGLFKEDKNLHPPKVTDYMKMLARLAKTVINDNEVHCNYSSENGAVTYSILKTAINRYVDLIVMGKNGSNGPSEEYAGTHILQVAEKSRIPLIVVPESTTRYCFENILFPVRPLLSVPAKYDAIRSFLLKNNPQITILNLRNPDYENELHIIHRLSMLMKEKLEADNVKYSMEHYFQDARFATQVLKMMRDEEEKFDLAVITAETEKSNKDFHIGNYARKLIHQCNIPILVMRPENAKQDKDKVLHQLDMEMQIN